MPDDEDDSLEGVTTFEDFRRAMFADYLKQVGDRPLPAFYIPQEVALMLRVSLRSVYNWMRSGKLPASKVGDSWRVSQRQLDAFLEAGTTAAASPGPEGPPAPQRARKKGRRR